MRSRGEKFIRYKKNKGLIINGKKKLPNDMIRKIFHPYLEVVSGFKG